MPFSGIILSWIINYVFFFCTTNKYGASKYSTRNIAGKESNVINCLFHIWWIVFLFSYPDHYLTKRIIHSKLKEVRQIVNILQKKYRKKHNWILATGSKTYKKVPKVIKRIKYNQCIFLSPVADYNKK